MKKGPAQAFLGFAITALIAWMHSERIWPFNSILNELITLVVMLLVLFYCWRTS
jgi:hypothetical protein